MKGIKKNALALEYKGNYGTARGDLDISYIVNNPFVNSPRGILCFGFPEESSDFPRAEIRVMSNDCPDSSLVTIDSSH